MRIALTFALAAGFLLTNPIFASTVSPTAPAHPRRAHFQRTATSGCGIVAGHASHTLLANPASVPCHSSAVPAPSIPARNIPARSIPAPSIPARAVLVRRPAAAVVATQPATIHATIKPLARVHFVPPLRGSLESLVRQNQRDEAEGLGRIEDDAQLEQLESSREIVPLPASSSLRVNPGLPANRRYCRPWTAHFLSDLARSHYARFHRAFQVNSAVRTVAFQRALLEVNGNAAPADGDIASPHLTGAAIDIGKKGMSFSELSWMRAWLLPLQTAGKIDVEEEFYQSCFHITVYSGYAPLAPARPAQPRIIARRRHTTTTLLAAGVH
jgi:uncharacterized protein DUF5715